MAFCCLCERTVTAWLPHPQRAARSHFMVMMETVGSDLSIYACPHCGCNDRDRHLWMYMAAAGLPEQLAGASILHLAPEQSLEPRLQACGPASYIRGDLFPARASSASTPNGSRSRTNPSTSSSPTICSSTSAIRSSRWPSSRAASSRAAC